MGKIRQLREDQIVNGGSQEHIYPVTHTKAVYSKDRQSLQDIIDSIREGNFLKDGSIKTRHLKDKAVTTSKLDDGSVDNRVLAIDAVETENILDNAVLTSKIADQNVTKEKIADQSVDNSKLSPEAVTYDKLKDKSVITEKLNDRAVTTEKVEEKAITNAKLGDQSVDGRVIREASVESKHIGNNAVSTPKIASRSVTNEKIAYNSVSRAELTPDVRNSIDKKADAEQVNNSLYDLEKKIGERFVVEGDVTNLPDEEDLTSVKESDRDVLKLADRSYAPQNFSGKGYKILRKNIKQVSIAVTKIQIESVPSADGTLSFTINGKETQVAVSATTDNTTALVAQKVAAALQESIAEYDVSIDASLITLTRKFYGSVTPSVFSASTTGVVCTITDSTKREYRNILMPNMINQPNTIYEIRYDFDLNGETIRIPDECTILFAGCTLRNGKIIYNKTFIKRGDVTFCSVMASGTLTNETAYSDWFGDAKNKDIDASDQINCLLSCGASLLIINKGVYQLNKDIDGFKSRTVIDCSWSIFKPIIGCSVFNFKWENSNKIKYDIVLKNFRIQFSGNNIGVIVDGNYFIYCYNFDITCNDTDGNIGILEKNNFNTAFRDGRLYGLYTNPLKNFEETQNIAIKLETTDNDYNTQISNITFDNILIQSFKIAVFADYGNDYAQDLIQFSDMGITYSGIGYYYKSGFCNSAINGSRITNCLTAIKVDMCRNLSVRDIYAIKSGFLEVSGGNVVLEGHYNAFLPKTEELKEHKRFLNITGGKVYWNTEGDSYGYTLDSIVSGDYIIRNGVKGNISVLNYNFPYTFNNRIYCKNNKGIITNTILQDHDLFGKRILQNEYTRLSVNTNDFNIIIQNNVDNIVKGEVGQIIRVESNNDNVVYINAGGTKYFLTKGEYLFLRCYDTDLWKPCFLYNQKNILYCSDDAKPSNVPGTVYFSKTIGKMLFCNEDRVWVDTNGSPADYLQKGSTENRPALNKQFEGFEYYDTDIKKKILWNGTTWVNMDGTALS